MVKCPSCQTSHPENTLFCEECGLYLAKDSHKGTDPLSVQDISWAERNQAESVQTGNQDSLLSLKLTIVDSGRRIAFPLTKEVIIGRLDPATATFPDIDLTADGGLEKGVSRRHAKITCKEAKVIIEDLGSINGTFVNNTRLTPYLPHPLKSGDELQLGKLIIEVHF